MNKAESKYFNTAIKFNKALLSLLEKKPFEYITISEICEKAGVNRPPFIFTTKILQIYLKKQPPTYLKILLHIFLPFLSTSHPD